MRKFALLLLLSGCVSTVERDGLSTATYCVGLCITARNEGKVSAEAETKKGAVSVDDHEISITDENEEGLND